MSKDKEFAMSEIMNSYEEEREKMASVAMQIVIHAGDGRNLIMEALDCTAEGKYDQAEDKLKDAKEELRQAHIFQTEIVQSEAAGKKYEYSLLFTHAQDTVMTVCTEMNLARKMITMYRELDRRLNVLEKKDGGRYD
ncbi:MAG: PTS lactose/cellobiose transporter subunit IIA [Enterocloster aldenensis]|jgi:PTS system cellobiose-specific IIA component|nr:PTS lactose/cellobiose transporter subunit IIA [uncultured Lachnoclostridium sp.]MCB7336832.1 PTS lactose/cellobiose transporter subunit IIA [Enterocloster aldenensis]